VNVAREDGGAICLKRHGHNASSLTTQTAATEKHCERGAVSNQTYLRGRQ
jgi:hypothetical protein